jgi:hypothetical protein
MLEEIIGDSPEAMMTLMPNKTNTAMQEMVSSAFMFMDLDIGITDAFTAA